VIILICLGIAVITVDNGIDALAMVEKVILI